jgi:acyl-CoA thioester hydrolase
MNLNDDIDSYQHRVSENIRFSETDMLGHVNNTVFGIYFEIGRSSYFYDQGFYKQDQVVLVIVKTEIHFSGMIYWPGKVEIGTRVTGFGNSSFTIDQILRQEDRIVGRAISTMVAIDPATNKSTPIPDNVRALLIL